MPFFDEILLPHISDTFIHGQHGGKRKWAGQQLIFGAESSGGGTMVLETLQVLRQAEEEAGQTVDTARREAAELVRQAQDEAVRLVEQAREEGQADAVRLLAKGEEDRRRSLETARAEAERLAEELRHSAAERVPAAAALVVERIVTDGRR